MKAVLQPRSPDPAAAISALATELADLINGYRTMVEKADPELKPVVERLLAMHETHSAELLNLSVGLGAPAESTGSFMGMVHKAVAHVRDLADALDESALDAILSGEKSVLATYDETAGAVSDVPEALHIVTQQRDALAETVSALK